MEIVDYNPDKSLQAYRIKVTVRNNLLLTAIEEAGYKSSASFAREIGHTEQEISSLVALRKAPINANGEFCPLAKDVMEALGAAPSDLWTTEQLTMKLPKNSVDEVVTTRFLLDTTAMQSVLGGNVLQLEGATYEDIETPEQIQTKKELADLVEANMHCLNFQQQRVIRMRYGFGSEKEHTLEEVADKLQVTRERIRQVEAKALRKLREASKMKPGEDF
jgi:RNA polymerase sigma factor (sigma-70 family)